MATENNDTIMDDNWRRDRDLKSSWNKGNYKSQTKLKFAIVSEEWLQTKDVAYKPVHRAGQEVILTLSTNTEANIVAVYTQPGLPSYFPKIENQSHVQYGVLSSQSEYAIIVVH